MSILTEKQSQVNTVEFWTVEDGVHPYSDPIDKWVVILDGEEVGWYRDQGQAWAAYNDMLRLDREHGERNLDNGTILFASFARNNGEVSIWESCPECGRIRDVGESCPTCDIPFRGEPVYAGQGWGGAPYGLEARG